MLRPDQVSVDFPLQEAEESSIVTLIKLRKIRWVGHTARVKR